MSEKTLMARILDACPDRVLPRGTVASDLTWAWRLNNVDMTSSHGYRWPHPGKWAKAPGPFTKGRPCPSRPDDGLCVALDLQGAQSGGASLYRSTGLLVGYLSADLLGSAPEKVRVKRAWVADTFDAFRVLCVRRANLLGANLSYANLSYANLSYADLRYADLRYANLSGTDLRYADLRYANLSGTNLSGTNLSPHTLMPAGFDKSRLMK